MIVIPTRFYLVRGTRTLSAVNQELMQVTVPAGVIIFPRRVHVKANTSESVNQLVFQLAWKSTAGTGGTARTPIGMDHPDYVASSCSCLDANSTPAGGTTTIIANFGRDMTNEGWKWFDYGMGWRRRGSNLVFSLLATPSPSVSVLYDIVWGEFTP